MSLHRTILRARERGLLHKTLQLDRHARPNPNGAAARKRRKRLARTTLRLPLRSAQSLLSGARWQR
jgi:hypothetical protein